MKKRIGIIAIISIIILISFLLIIIVGNKKMIVTYCDDSNNCKIDLINSKVDTLFRRYKKYNSIKVDEIINEKEASKDDLYSLIYKTSSNEFDHGIIINNKIYLLCEEINSNEMIDYKNKKLDLENINKYLKNKNTSITEDDLNNIKIFNTNAFYKNKQMDSKIKLVFKNGFNVRDYDNSDLTTIIDNCANKLLDMQQDNGRFIYGYKANTGEMINTYNIVRHAGSVYSLIKYYEYNQNKDLKEKIEKSIDYLLDNYTKKYNKNTLLVVEKSSNEIKLGGNALTLLMLAEYNIAFRDDRYQDNASKIANGVLLFQNSDGSLNHVLDMNFKVKDKRRTTYYDGEAAFSLLRYYEITHTKKYYKSAKKIIDMFIKNDYTKYSDQWVSYSLNQFLKFNIQDKYIKFALNNYNNNKFDYISDFDPTKLELLTITLNTYNYLNDGKNSIIESFDIDALKNSIEHNKKVLLNYYLDDSYSMYFKKPNNTKYGFVDINDSFRMRIDDIQHSLTGLLHYYIYLVK